jgi:hypothetical protein
MALKLHHLNASRSQRIVWLLLELGVPHEVVHHKRNETTRLAPADLKKIHPVDLKDVSMIQEHVNHSWYKYPDETKGLHPFGSGLHGPVPLGHVAQMTSAAAAHRPSTVSGRATNRDASAARDSP